MARYGSFIEYDAGAWKGAPLNLLKYQQKSDGLDASARPKVN